MVSVEEQLKYIYNLKYISIYFYKEYKNIKSLSIYCNININKLSNTLIKLNCWSIHTYLNNLPLNLKYIISRVNCNLPPNIIYLNCYLCDFHNLPRSLQFIYTYNENKILKELIDIFYNKNNINFILGYEYIKKLKSIY